MNMLLRAQDSAPHTRFFLALALTSVVRGAFLQESKALRRRDRDRVAGGAGAVTRHRAPPRPLAGTAV